MVDEQKDVERKVVDLSKRRSEAQSADRDAFSRRVYKMMLAKGMNQSDLARAAGLERNRISAYVRGTALPTGLKLKLLADALGVKPTDLIPDERLAPAKPAYAMSVSADGKTAHLTADVKVPAAIGAQIIALFGEHAIAHGE